MLIRCEKCSTLYELDERLLPQHGAPVQCSKCQFVFKAYPPAEQAPGTVDERFESASAAPLEQEESGDVPHGEPAEPAGSAEPAARREEVLPARSPDLVREGGALSSPAAYRVGTAPPPVPSQGGEEPRFTADGRPIRKVPFPTSDASSPGVRPTATRIPAPRAARGLEAAALMRWVVVAVVLAAIAIGAALAWRTYRGKTTRAGARPPIGQSAPDVQGGTAGSQPRK